jgi:hypothetical protein
MAQIAVALFPSNQDRNISPIIPAYNEAGGMGWIANLIAAGVVGKQINLRVFAGALESTDKPLPNGKPSYTALQNQLKEGYAWLPKQPEPIKIGLHMHTDSGEYSHTWGIYSHLKDPRGIALIYAICSRVHKFLGTSEFNCFDYYGGNNYNEYYFATLCPAGCIPVMAELCTHTVDRDIRRLWETSGQVAALIIEGLEWFAGSDQPMCLSQVAELQAKNADYLKRLASIKQTATI